MAGPLGRLFTCSPTLPTSSLRLRQLDLLFSHVALLAIIIVVAHEGPSTPVGKSLPVIIIISILASTIFNLCYIKLHNRIPGWAQVLCSLIFVLAYAFTLMCLWAFAALLVHMLTFVSVEHGYPSGIFIMPLTVAGTYVAQSFVLQFYFFVRACIEVHRRRKGTFSEKRANVNSVGMERLDSRCEMGV